MRVGCPVCHRVFASRSRAQAHVNTQHTAEEKPIDLVDIADGQLPGGWTSGRRVKAAPAPAPLTLTETPTEDVEIVDLERRVRLGRLNKELALLGQSGQGQDSALAQQVQQLQGRLSQMESQAQLQAQIQAAVAPLVAEISALKQQAQPSGPSPSDQVLGQLVSQLTARAFAEPAKAQPDPLKLALENRLVKAMESTLDAAGLPGGTDLVGMISQGLAAFLAVMGKANSEQAGQAAGNTLDNAANAQSGGLPPTAEPLAQPSPGAPGAPAPVPIFVDGDGRPFIASARG